MGTALEVRRTDRLKFENGRTRCAWRVYYSYPSGFPLDTVRHLAVGEGKEGMSSVGASRDLHIIIGESKEESVYIDGEACLLAVRWHNIWISPVSSNNIPIWKIGASVYNQNLGWGRAL